MRIEDQIKAMIQRQIVARGIEDKKVIDAFMKVPRHLFVPEEVKHLAYYDSPLSIGYGQTISQPFTVAFMMSILDLNKSDEVLEIGTGSGYQTALLAELVKKVYTIERIKELSENAQSVIAYLGYDNVEFYIGDGSKGWYNESKKFDKIIVTAGAPIVPESLLKQLKIGGKMVIPVGGKSMQSMKLIVKEIYAIEEYDLGEFAFVPLIGKEGWQK